MSSHLEVQKQDSRWRLPLLIILISVLGAASFWWKSAFDEKTPDWLAKSQTALESGNPQKAIEYATLILNEDSERSDAHLLVAQAASQQGLFELALNHCAQIDDGDREQAVEARRLAGDIYRKVNRDLERAEREFERALKLHPDRLDVRARLIDLLALQTKTDELAPHIIHLIERGEIRPEYLMLLASGQRLAPQAEVLNEYARQQPIAPGIRLALARRAVLEDRVSLAESLLSQLVAEDPQLEVPQGRLGKLLVSHGLENQWQTWFEALPPRVDHALIWEARGLDFLKQNDRESAIRCFGEALSRDPNLIAANYQLGQSLIQLGHREAATSFLERARSLQEYDRLLDLRKSGPADFVSRVPYLKASELAESLGLLWESYGWAVLAVESGQQNTAMTERIRRIRSRFPNLPKRRTVDAAFPDSRSIGEAYSLPNTIGPRQTNSRVSGNSGGASLIQFTNIAGSAGIQFSYFNSSDPAVKGLGRMYEFTGGGIAVLDYDRDGWPDLYCTQGQTWSSGDNDSQHLDQLYRNGGHETFTNVTEAACVLEDQFSQGVAVGDINNDGFPDLYVANIGVNQLFLNQGDGTFTQADPRSFSQMLSWTTSCLMADLNADGLPDLYDVNYLAGAQIFEIVCRNERGVQQSCAPQDFSGEPDRCYLNLGNGEFQDISEQCGVALPEGKGMGIVCWQRSGSLTPDLLISNDGVPNFYFVNESGNTGDLPRFHEVALLSGLALNRDGESEACMGIAAGDWDRDSRLDFFMTNFTYESNTLYTQSSDQLFVDETAAAGLHQSSLRRLGFGAQAIDGNLDGQLDLAITNGHIDDYSQQGMEYEMSAQFYRNEGDLHFVEQPPEQTGPYFTRKVLGRGMSKCDFNRDGLEDLMISHLDFPLALLKNETIHNHHFLAISLCGIHCARDAIGAIVTVKTSEGTLTRHLIAGDGYQASNQRLLIFGLSEASRVLTVTITWPSGTTQTFHDPPVDCQLHVLEGRGYFRLPN